MAEVDRKYDPRDPTSMLGTNLGCFLQWFMYDLYKVRRPCATSGALLYVQSQVAMAVD